MKNRVAEILETMGDQGDLDKVLEQHKLTPLKAMTLFKSKTGRRELRARRWLARIHSDIVAQRYGSFAVQKLIELLGVEEPQIRLKGAIALLAAAGLGEKKRAGAAKKPEGSSPPPIELDDEEAMELLAAFVEVKKSRQARIAGHISDQKEIESICLPTTEKREC